MSAADLQTPAGHAYLVAYKDETTGIELGRDEQGEAFDLAWHLFSDRRTPRGSVTVSLGGGIPLTLLELRWNVEGLETEATT